jgi:hypothetical protein
MTDILNKFIQNVQNKIQLDEELYENINSGGCGLFATLIGEILDKHFPEVNYRIVFLRAGDPDAVREFKRHNKNVNNGVIAAGHIAIVMGKPFNEPMYLDAKEFMPLSCWKDVGDYSNYFRRRGTKSFFLKTNATYLKKVFESNPHWWNPDWRYANKTRKLKLIITNTFKSCQY